MKYGFLSEKNKVFPNIVHVETTNVCNLRCIHCPHSDISKMPNYKPQYMNFNIFRKVVDEVSKNKGVLRLTPDGEPMLHPDWTKQVEAVLNSDIEIFCFNTNGILMDKDKKDVLLMETDTKIAIEFSIDSLYPESYKNIRRGGDYRKLLSNIFGLLDERYKKGRDNIKILVSCIIQPELRKGEYESFVDFWTPLVDKVITRHYVDTKGLTPKKDVQKIPDKRWPCPVLFSRIVVGMDGSVRFCPDDWLKKTIIGNINDNSLSELWKSDKMNYLRKSHLDGTFDNEVCRKCTDWSVIHWGNDYVKALKDLFK